MKRKGCLIPLVIGILLIILLIYGIFTSFDPVYSSTKIKQKIGGVLICNTIYNADHHTWQYDVNYKYQASNDSVYEIGQGTYYSREWNQDEQLIKYGKWIILKTGNWAGSDKIIVGNLKSKEWTEYKFTPENIEKSNIWTSSQTHSLLNYCCAESYITKINNGEIIVQYKFRIDENNTDLMGTRNIKYQIDTASGDPNMTGITVDK
ncbi:hypothetical protein [Pedobacter cryophilus]|uniref:Uncharacterized protein n=1 Tax=Pedobacter cryophilus TaxID=2571271 RepID=A0A4U1C1N1_9SPHI|nr:hypothetical protein [Pedobacter cryophilus]TKB99131.1 hypothetical protein FA046_08465 [Pedobacter cryophilus]